MDIVIAGSILTDKVKLLPSFPVPGMLTPVESVQMSVGGCVPNTGIDLARLDPSVRVRGMGRVGDDTEGRFVLDAMQAAGMDTSLVRVGGEATSFSDVLTVPGGERTFLHYRGANRVFDFEADEVPQCALFHLGYLLLLDRLDAPDPQYGTRAARLLAGVQARGIPTSIDLVSETGARFRAIAAPALRYCDYCVVNEIEGGEVTGVNARDAAGALIPSAVKEILQGLLALGVRRRAVVHCPEAGFSLDAAGNFAAVPSLRLPDGYIKGAVGAGDAFCAGMLYALTHDYEPEAALELAACTAARNLASVDSVGGATTLAETLELKTIYPRRTL